VPTIEIATPHGPARAHLTSAGSTATGLLVLGHGAGGGTSARDLAATAATALAMSWSVALVEQPYRVAGRRSPAPAAQLDVAWQAVVDRLTQRKALKGLPLVTGGRSSGARVACRTAAATGASGVLCLAFPVRPPSRATTRPDRLDELDGVSVPVLVVQGVGDPFGVPPDAPGRTVVQLRGNHSLTSDLPGLRAAVGAWLGSLDVY
jgi:predicted alpha/beta-hydrolase family hydrolase